MMRTLIFLTCFCVSGVLFAQKTSTVSITVDHFSSDNGQLVIGLYHKDNFLKAAPDFGKVAAIKNGKAEVVFTNVPEGTYAVACYQDINGNMRLDRTDKGYPKEDFGFSNNPKVMGYPQFDPAKFTVDDATVKVHIKMVHVKN